MIGPARENGHLPGCCGGWTMCSVEKTGMAKATTREAPAHARTSRTDTVDECPNALDERRGKSHGIQNRSFNPVLHLPLKLDDV
jgi:hypothetical protein